MALFPNTGEGEEKKEANSSSTSGATHVYVRSAQHGWIPARVISLDKAKHEAIVAMEEYPEGEQGMLSSSPTSTCTSTEQPNLFTVDLRDYRDEVLPLQNVDESGELMDYEDMVDFPYLHEAAILYNLKKRHIDGRPYTRSGDVVIAMNPYHWFAHLYTTEEQQFFADKLLWDDLSPRQLLLLEDNNIKNDNTDENGDNSDDDGGKTPKHQNRQLSPHVYEISTLAYKGMALWGRHQSILVSGESGAGKTETVKICMNHIATLQRGPKAHAEGETRVVQRVLDTNPLLESFGNAQTRRNDNSSRFGRYTQLQFDRMAVLSSSGDKSTKRSQTSPARLAGSTCEVYLLEKNRVTQHDLARERTFHIFYELLAAPRGEQLKIWDGLKGATQDSFSYVGRTNTNRIEGVTDKDRFRMTVDALEDLGISGTLLVDLFRSLCVVLALGNIAFAPDPTDDDKPIIRSEPELDQLASLMGIPKAKLRPALTERTMTTRDETYKIPVSATAAKESCDGLAKDIYEKVFLWLVRTLNLATCAEENYEHHQGRRSDDYGIIGLLDIFGFEAFQVNRFEQLCINYANEKLQSKFTEDCFKSVEVEYKQEGIPLEHIMYNDNTDVLDLIEGRTGLLAMLNEECWRPQGNAVAFVKKSLHQNEKSPCLIINKLDQRSFGIHHYAGKVLYDADDFVTRNQDRLPSDLKECAAMTANSIISSEYKVAVVEEEAAAAPAKGGRSGDSNLMAATVWTKYRSQLSQLMADLRKTETRYIRTIKPNSVKEPLIVEHTLTIAQLRSCGIVASVTISRSAFPNKMLNKNVLTRFSGILKHQIHRASATTTTTANNNARPGTPQEHWKEDAQALLSSALKSTKFTDPNTGRVYPAFIVGKTKTFFRAGALEVLEAQRLNGLDEQATIIQRHYRKFCAHKRAILQARARAKRAERRQVKRAAEKKAMREERAREARMLDERLAAEWREFLAKMDEEDRKFAEQLEKEELERQAEMDAKNKLWEEKMAREEEEWKLRMEEEREAFTANLVNDDLEKHLAEIAALTKEIEDFEDETDRQLQDLEERRLRLREERKQIENRIDELEAGEDDEKRKLLFCRAMLSERERFSDQLKHENKRLMKRLARTEEKYDALKKHNEELKKTYDESGAKFQERKSSNIDMGNHIVQRQELYKKVKAENDELHAATTMQQEAYSLMTQSRLEAQHTMSAILEIVQAESTDMTLHKDIMHMNLDLSKESYRQLKEVTKRQEEAKEEMVDYSVSDFNQSWVAH